MDVVVGIAGGTRSDEAVRRGAQEAQARGAALVLVHAYAVPAVPSVAGPLRTPEMRRYAEDVAAQLVSRAARLARSSAEGPLLIRTAVLRGAPADVLLEQVGPQDLLVIGCHRSRLRHSVGSTVRTCVRARRCPVLVVMPAEVREPVPVG